MTEAEAKKAIAAGSVFKVEDRDDDIWRIDLPELNRSVDVHATSEAEAQAKAIEFLVNESR